MSALQARVDASSKLECCSTVNVTSTSNTTFSSWYFNFKRLSSFLDKTLRLAGGYRSGEGRVEIFRDGHWGTVCDDFWDFKDAQVVCRSLGHERALLAPQFAAFGEGNGHIWLDNVHCVGNESSIEDCPHNGWGNNDCSHTEDASVICSNETVQIGG